MKWCRIIEDGADQYLCVLAPATGGLAIVTTWMEGGMPCSAALPPEEFSGPEDAYRFLHALCAENVRMLRRSANEQRRHEAEVEASAAAAEVIARVKGLH